MLSDRRRKSLHLNAGLPYSFGEEQDRSLGYLRAMLGFLGIADQETVLLKGDDPEQGSIEEYEAARRKLLKMARGF
jgi:FMN-dependent NADH-azoreductase